MQSASSPKCSKTFGSFNCSRLFPNKQLLSVPNKCQCQHPCRHPHPDAVNVILRSSGKRIFSQKELLDILKTEKGLGKEAARKKLRFLHHIDTKTKESVFGCRYVGVLTNRSDCIFLPESVIFFKGMGRIFFSRAANEQEILTEVEKYLTSTQKEILEIFNKRIFGLWYFSSYDIKRLIPERGSSISQGLQRLVEMGFLTKSVVRSNIQKLVFGKSRKLDFYTTMEDAKRFAKRNMPNAINEIAKNSVTDETTEVKVILKVQENFRKTPWYYTSFEGTLRPKKRKFVGSVRGMSFDLVLPVEISGNKTLFAIDVYTRFPLTHKLIERFAQKIEKANSFGFIFGREDLKGDFNGGQTGIVANKFFVGFLERRLEFHREIIPRLESIFYLESTSYHKIRRRVLSLSEKSWLKIENNGQIDCIHDRLSPPSSKKGKPTKYLRHCCPCFASSRTRKQSLTIVDN